MLRTDGQTRRRIRREYALDVEVSGCVDQLVLLHVDQKSKVSQVISSENGRLYSSDDENPRKKAEVEGERSFPVRMVVSDHFL